MVLFVQITGKAQQNFPVDRVYEEFFDHNV